MINGSKELYIHIQTLNNERLYFLDPIIVSPLVSYTFNEIIKEPLKEYEQTRVDVDFATLLENFEFIRYVLKSLRSYGSYISSTYNCVGPHNLELYDNNQLNFRVSDILSKLKSHYILFPDSKLFISKYHFDKTH